MQKDCDVEQSGGEGRQMLRRPNVLVSACLLGVSCRYNEKADLDEAVHGLMEEANLIPVCPEIFGGLPTPRSPAERVGDRVITLDGRDVTAQYRKGAEQTCMLAGLYRCSCAILKERSPSCGCGSIYDGTCSGTLTEGNGCTSEQLLQKGVYVFGESQVEECRKFLKNQKML